MTRPSQVLRRSVAMVQSALPGAALLRLSGDEIAYLTNDRISLRVWA